MYIVCQSLSKKKLTNSINKSASSKKTKSMNHIRKYDIMSNTYKVNCPTISKLFTQNIEYNFYLKGVSYKKFPVKHRNSILLKGMVGESEESLIYFNAYLRTDMMNLIPFHFLFLLYLV